MRLLLKCDQTYIAKRLAAIYYTATHWDGNDWEFVEKVLSNVADIAFRCGGMNMMETQVPCLVDEIDKFVKSKGEEQ